MKKCNVLTAIILFLNFNIAFAEEVKLDSIIIKSPTMEGLFFSSELDTANFVCNSKGYSVAEITELQDIFREQELYLARNLSGNYFQLIKQKRRGAYIAELRCSNFY